MTGVARVAKFNILANYANFAALAIVGLIANPGLEAALGPAAFGVWKATTRFLEFANLADGRATQALKWVIAHRSGAQDDEQARRDVGAAVAVWALWLPVLVPVSAAMVLGLPILIKDADVTGHDTVYWVGIILCTNLVLTGLLNIPDAALTGTSQGYRSMNITTIVRVAVNLAILVAAKLGHGLIALGVITVVGSVLNGAWTYAVARRRVEWWGATRPHRRDVRQLGVFGGWVLLWLVVLQLLLSADLLLISALNGSVAVTNYVFTSFAVQTALGVSGVTTSAFTPQIGRAVGAGDRLAGSAQVDIARQVHLAVAGVLASCVLLFNRSFVELWAGPERFMGAGVNVLMVAAFLQFTAIRADAQIHDTGLRIGRRTVVGAITAVASIAVGAAALTALDSVAWMYVGLIVPRVVLTMAMPRLLRQVVSVRRGPARRWIAVTALLATSALAGSRISISGVPEFIGACVLGFGVASLVAYSMVLSPSARARLRNNAGLSLRGGTSHA